MDNFKKVVVGVMVFLLLGIFLVTFGNGITGYAVLNKEIKLDSYPMPFVRNGGYDNVYIVVPNEDNKNELVAADKIAAGLQGSRLGRPLIIRENQLQAGKYNLIFVGNPCTLETLNALMGNSCDLDLGNDGMIKLVDLDTRRYLIVAGSDEGILKAADVLRNYQTYGLAGKEIIVSGELGNPLSLNLKIR